MNTANRDFISELKFKTSRSSGKGGQHVNKTESRISLFFNVTNSELLSEEEKNRMLNSDKITVNGKGEIQIDVEQSRSQIQNKKIGIERFYQILAIGLKKPKLRRTTKPTKAAVKKRLKGKKIQSEKKQNRKKDFL
jgi:ribosome-associated protein